MLEPPILVTFGIAQVFGILAVIFVILAGCNDYKNVYATATTARKRHVWHPTIMSFSMVYLFGCAAVIYRVLRSVKKLEVKLIHAGIHMLVGILALTGVTFAILLKDTLPGGEHFTSVHGLFGIITIILYVLQWLISIPVFLWPKAPDKIRAPGMVVHVCMGVGVFLSSTVTAMTGFNGKQPPYTKPTSVVFYKTAAFFYFFYVLVILYVANTAKYKRPPDGQTVAKSKSVDDPDE